MDKTENWNSLKLVKWVSKYLEDHKIPPPHRFEAESLIAYVLNLSRLDIYLQYDKPWNKRELELLKKLLQRRIKREPLSYILGDCEFWSLTLEVGPGVLIPRQDTESIIESILPLISDEENRKVPFCVLELGTGSGAIPLALCSERKNLSILTLEKSKKAIHFAKRNFSRYAENLIKKKITSLLCKVTFLTPLKIKSLLI